MKSFLTGLSLGAAVGLLMAPKSGRETRNDLQELARNSYEGGRDRLQELLERANDRMQPMVDKARQGIDAARDRIQPVADQVSEQASQVRDQVRDKVAEVTQSTGRNDLMSILNDWPHERLIEIDGIGPVLATKIIQNRPYESEEDLIESKQLPPSAIESLRNAA
jgi:gas vesicle protein